MKKKVSREALWLSILTFLTVLTWIAYDVYQALTRYTLPEVLEEQMRSLDPQIDKAQIERLKQRLKISEEELDKITIPRIEESPASATTSGERL